MSNKLKGIFSNKKVDFGGNIRFKDHEAYENFLKALNIVETEGKAVKVDGITSIQTTVRDGENKYPFLEQEEILDFVVCPSYEEVPFEIDTKNGKQTLLLKRCYTKDSVILETDQDAIVYLKIIFKKGTSKTTFSYKTQPDKAKNISEVITSYELVSAFINRLFAPEKKKEFPDDFNIIENIKTYLSNSIKWYQKLDAIERFLNIAFDLGKINEDENNPTDLEELYLLLIEKKVLRLNAKLHETETTGIAIHKDETQIALGSPLDITFQGTAEYLVCGEKIVLHTANLLSNAVVKEVEKLDGESIRVLYGDKDSCPMYISYSGFLSGEDAAQEVKKIMEHKEKYQAATTVNEYLQAE